MFAAVAVIVLKMMDMDVLSLAAGCAVCLMLALYWGAFFILRKRY